MFSQMKFYLHPQVQELNKIREILNKNGGVVIDQSNDMDQDVIYIVDAKEASQNQQELDSLQNRGIRVICMWLFCWDFSRNFFFFLIWYFFWCNYPIFFRFFKDFF